MRKHLWVVILSVLLPVAASAQMIDDFETGVLDPNWTQANPGDPIGTNVSGIAAHDGNYGLEAGTIRTGWIYRNDAQAQLAQGDVMTLWTQLGNSTWTRNYIGFFASAAGCISMVLGDNTNTWMIQLNSGYGYSNLIEVPYTFINRYWYRAEIVTEVGGALTANLYDSDGTTLLATCSTVNNTYTSGGVALRSFDSGQAGYFDSIDKNPGTPVETASWGEIKAMF